METIEQNNITIDEISSISGISASILRLDKIHKQISGNKWYKLKYHLEDAKKLQKDTIVTFGGAYSNHIIATAVVCKMFHLKAIGIIRGEQPEKLSHTLKDMAAKYPIAVGIDAMNGMVAVEGWAEVSTMKATDLAQEFANAGVQAIICTDISKDGMLCGVNVEFTESIALASNVDTIASGGVKDINDIINCKNNGNIAGVIVGKAFYEGTLDLEEAFNILKK